MSRKGRGEWMLVDRIPLAWEELWQTIRSASHDKSGGLRQVYLSPDGFRVWADHHRQCEYGGWDCFCDAENYGLPPKINRALRPRQVGVAC